VRQREQKDAKQIASPNSLDFEQLVHPGRRDADGPPKDWSELGRRVLVEAMRRSLRCLRRQNGREARGDIGGGPRGAWS
jgi:hypothetical protein